MCFTGRLFGLCGETDFAHSWYELVEYSLLSFRQTERGNCGKNLLVIIVVESMTKKMNGSDPMNALRAMAQPGKFTSNSSSSYRNMG